MAKTASPTHKPDHQDIARRAREIYEQNGRVSGRDLQNWLQAEAELTTSAAQAAPKESAKTATPKTNGRGLGNKAPNNRTYAG